MCICNIFITVRFEVRYKVQLGIRTHTVGYTFGCCLNLASETDTKDDVAQSMCTTIMM